MPRNSELGATRANYRQQFGREFVAAVMAMYRGGEEAGDFSEHALTETHQMYWEGWTDCISGIRSVAAGLNGDLTHLIDPAHMDAAKWMEDRVSQLEAELRDEKIIVRELKALIPKEAELMDEPDPMANFRRMTGQ